MKRLCSVAAMALITGGLLAQRAAIFPPQLEMLQEDAQVVTPSISALTGGQRDVVFTEDFANGLAGNNGFGAWTVEGPNGNVWRFNTNSPNGAYTTGNQYIQSTTAANGAAIFASDSANTDWSATPPAIVASPVDLEGPLVSPILDLSATPEMEISFQQRSRFCCGTSPFYLEVSTDGGVTWPTSFITNEGLPLNQGAPNVSGGPVTTETRTFSLMAAIAPDPSNVRFRFRHNSEAGSSHYFWQIDDVQLSTLAPFELVMNYGYTTQFGSGFEYGRVPQSQMPSSMEVGAEIFNYGGSAQDNVVVNVSLTDQDDVEVASAVIPLGTMGGGTSMVATTQLDLPEPMAVGLYTAQFTVSSDQSIQDLDPTNNVKQRRFEVTGNLYSLDGVGGVNPAAEQSISSAGTASFAENTQDVRLLNYFVVTNPETFYGVEVVLATQSQTGSYFIGTIYDTTDVYSGEMASPLAETEIRIIVQSDLQGARKATAIFYDPITLDPGAYFVAVRLYQEATKNIYIVDDLTVPQPVEASMLWIPVDANNTFLYGGNGNAWAVRLTSDATVGVQEHTNLEGITVYPSPTSGLVQVRSEQHGNMQVEVFNVLGELVQSASFNGTATTLDLTGHSAGIYTVRVSDGARSNVQRVVLK